MNSAEWRATAGLGGIYLVRMLGLFMVLPVFALFAGELPHASPAMVGLALGAYGLTQALLQIPFGMASDRFGRKFMMAVGLLLFAAGSLVAAWAPTIEWMVLGRLLQGSGAIAAVANALLADLTRESQRTKAMLLLGIGIGASFVVALVLGPVLDQWIGVRGIFLLTAGLALVCLPLLYLVVPAAPTPAATHAGILTDIRTVTADRQLLRLDGGIFILHAILTALFVALPGVLKHQGGLAEGQHWMFYLPVMVGSLALTLPLVQIVEKRGQLKPAFVAAVGVIGASCAALAVWHHALMVIGLIMFIFFGAFNLLEASLPSLVSRSCARELRGAGMGVYSSSQFMGAFAGGAGGGLLAGQFGSTGVFAAASVLACVWLAFAAGLRAPVATGAMARAD